MAKNLTDIESQARRLRLAYHFMIRGFQGSVVILHWKFACHVIVLATRMLPVSKSSRISAEEFCTDFRQVKVQGEKNGY
ncbi:MAG: hypothetical protein IIB68_04545 [Proteobacteria bacterium]|nr:hypothetical protein [Pseudomonadota bacterium]MCH8930483.1 hypothetical protein [Pseudomonadota bacterium]